MISSNGIFIRENKGGEVLIPKKCKACFWIDRVYEKTNEGLCQIEYSFIDLDSHNTCVKFKQRIEDPIPISENEYNRLKRMSEK